MTARAGTANKRAGAKKAITSKTSHAALRTRACLSLIDRPSFGFDLWTPNHPVPPHLLVAAKRYSGFDGLGWDDRCVKLFRVHLNRFAFLTAQKIFPRS